MRQVRVLVNNAAAAPAQRRAAADGTEWQLAVNVLAYFRLMQCLRAPLARASPSRIVNVVSEMAGGMQLDDLQWRLRT